MKKPGTLRNGFTTGSAAGAAAVAAFRQSAEPVELFLPGGGRLAVPVFRIWPGGASVIKDGGDDPDVTTGSEIRVELTPFEGEPGASDYLEKSDELELVVRGGPGVGIATRPGLAVPVGKSAINPTPRRMLLENLVKAGCKGRYLAVISVPGGEETARKTLNPTLGIEGGISILGNTGIVRPYSNAAYAATLVLQIGSIVASGGKTVALVTGNRSADAVARDYPELSPEAVIRIGDFIHVAVTAARKNKIGKVIVGCMPGKLFKYACGERNTHARECKLTLARLRDFGLDLPGLPLERMDTMGELAAHLEEAVYRKVLCAVLEKARSVLKQWAGETVVEVALYDDAGRRFHEND